MSLFKDRNLNIAILISASWHLLFMFAVTPVLISGNIKKNTTGISFLGSILEKVAVVPEKSFNLDKASFMHKLKQVGEIKSEPANSTLTPPEISGKVSGTELEKEIFMFSAEKGVVVNVYFKKKDKPLIDLKNSILTGEARNRLLLYRPELSKASTFPSDFNSDYTVGIKFNISEHGFVERPECILSSGSLVVDQAAIRYVRRWQFYPYDEEADERPEVTIRLNFNAL